MAPLAGSPPFFACGYDSLVRLHAACDLMVVASHPPTFPIPNPQPLPPPSSPAGAYDSLVRLRAACDLMVVTSRQHCIQEPTLEWLEEHFPEVGWAGEGQEG